MVSRLGVFREAMRAFDQDITRQRRALPQTIGGGSNASRVDPFGGKSGAIFHYANRGHSLLNEKGAVV